MSSKQYAVGVDLGTTYTCAAIADDGAPRVAQLTGTSQTIPSVVSKTDDRLLAGEAAERRLISHPAATAREFKRRFGDPAPIVLDGTTYGADALTAELLAEVLRRVATVQGTPATTVALSHPASWGPFRLDLLRSAAAQAGVDDVLLVPEPVAAAVANSDRVADGSLVAVYDLGGGTFDAALVRCLDDWSVVGTPEGVERLGGVDFDQAILAHVDAALDGQVFMLDSSDPDARSALMQLRAECQAAKEHLSQDTDVEIPVALPNLRTSVRLTRSEFEAMVRPRLADSLTVLDRVVTSAGVTWDDIAGVLLVGGSSNIPAVGQLVSEHTGRPIISATNPHLAIAIGTAAIAQRTVARPAAPAPASTPTSTPAPPVVPPPAPVAEADSTAPRKKPIGLIAGALVAVAAAAIAFVVITGGGDDTETADSAPTAEQPESSAPAVEQPDAPDVTGDPPEVIGDAPPGSAPTETSSLLAIDVCAADAGAAVRFGVTDSGMFIATPTDVVTAAPAALTACSIDVAGAPAADPGGPTVVTDITAYATALAFSTSTGGTVFNQTTGNTIACAELTGPAAITDDGALFVIDGDAIGRYALGRNGCTADDSSVFSDIAATSIAIGGRNRIAVTGADRATGATQLWVFEGVNNATAVDGFTQLDGVVRCGELWCALDLATGVVHLVTIDGAIAGDAPLPTNLSAPITSVLDLTSSPTLGTFALVGLGDGSAAMLRLSS